MGREVRRVPADWEHPKDSRGKFIPLYPGYLHEKHKEANEWKVVATDYMPDWPEEKMTHYQMYEDTSEGTPISPVMETPESLAQWLADNNASSFGGMTATYEQWLAVARGGWAPSAVVEDGELKSGVEHMGELKKRKRKPPKQASEYGPRGLYKVEHNGVWWIFATLSAHIAWTMWLDHEKDLCGDAWVDKPKREDVKITQIPHDKEVTVDFEGLEISLFPCEWYEIVTAMPGSHFAHHALLSCSEF